MTTGELRVATRARREMLDITERVVEIIGASGINDGVCYLFNPHTTAGLAINEGADPDVSKDLLGGLGVIVPEQYPYRHREGNSPAHLMAALTGSSLTVFLSGGRLRLGTWQRIFFAEFDGPRSRTVWWKLHSDAPAGR